ncbi:MAG: type II toxin-antitoxin system toxin DhiT [Sulfuricurvum sp.]
MPTISLFYGIVISLYYFDNEKHNTPHIHAKYQDFSGVFEIESGEMIEGDLPKNKVKLTVAWMEIHKEDLMADWELASTGQSVFKIEPLK